MTAEHETRSRALAEAYVSLADTREYALGVEHALL
jgi:hypothetical protein